MTTHDIFRPDISKLSYSRDIKGLIKALRHPDPLIARSAAGSLMEFAPADAVIPLTEALQSHDKDLRRMSASALGEIGDRRAIPALICAIRDKDWGVRLESVNALGLMGDTRNIPLFISLFRDENIDIRMAAVAALGRTGDTAAIEPLLQALVDPHHGIRNEAACALHSLGWKPAHLEDKSHYYLAIKDWESLGQLRGAAIGPLAWALKDEYFNIRLAAASTLGNMKDEHAVRYLIAAMNDEESSVRREIVSALGAIGDTRSLPALVRALHDDVAEVRMAAADALDLLSWKPETLPEKILYLVAKERWLELADCGNESQLPPVIQPDGRSCGIREEIARTLQKLGGPAVEPMVHALESQDPDVRRRALWVLGNIRDPRVLGPVIGGLNDESPECRKEAVLALGTLRDPRAIPFLSRALSRDEDLVPDAIMALGEIPDPAAIKVIIPFIRAPGAGIRIHAVRALSKSQDISVIGTLTSALDDPDSGVRIAVIAAMGQHAAAETFLLLSPALEDQDPEVRYAAAVAVAGWFNPEAVPALVSRLDDPDIRIRKVALQALDRRYWEPRTASERKKYGIAADTWSEPAEVPVPPGPDILSGTPAPTRGTPSPRQQDTQEPGSQPGISDRREMPASFIKLTRELADREEQPAVRWNAAEKLGERMDLRSVGLLRDALKDPDPELRWRSARALGKLADESAIEPLSAALIDDSMPVVRIHVAEALGHFRKPAAINVLIRALGDADPAIRHMVVQSLGEIKTEPVINALMVSLSDPDNAVRETAITTFRNLGTLAGKSLVKNLKNKNPIVKEGALLVLSRMSPDIRNLVLVAGLESSDAGVRDIVAGVLDSFGWQPENAYQKAMYLFAKKSWTELAALGKTAEGILIRGTSDRVAGIRIVSAEILGSIAENRAVPVLTDVLHDEDREVRLSSIKTILKLRAGDSSLILSGLPREPRT
nr:HEAT repeat domain-containing protein [uncultured Methanoregula sp.]